MRSLVLSLVFTLAIFSTFSVNKNHTVNLKPLTAYAQEASPAAIEVVAANAEIQVAQDLIKDNKFEIPAWAGSIVMFVSSVPQIGPLVTKALAFMAVISAILTLLSTLLMGLSGIMAMISKHPASPAWMIKAKNVLDILIKWAKYLSMYNVQKK